MAGLPAPPGVSPERHCGGLATPFAGFALSDAGDRTWRSGVRWTLGPDTAFGVEGTLREAANDNAGEHGVLFKFTSRW